MGAWIVLGAVKYRNEIVMRGGSFEGLWWGLGKWEVGRWFERTSGEKGWEVGGWLVRCAMGMEWWWIGVGLLVGGGWAGRRGYTGIFRIEGLVHAV